MVLITIGKPEFSGAWALDAGHPAGSRRGWSGGLEAALCRAPAAGLRPQDLGYIPDFVQTAMAPYINSPKIHIHQRVWLEGQ
ncbi:Ankyrin repeat and IBR domain-containing protein 1 [Manis javanica]|nr:Ankyrin repeat and IBR domain-containing protein 1 [Manis javanica]